VGGYLAIALFLKELVRFRGAPFDLREFVVFHNLFLSFISLIMFILFGSQLWWMLQHSSALDVFCDPKGQWSNGPVYFLWNCNLWIKMYEFIDTFLLAARGKPLDFLHVYHHASVFVILWSQLNAHTCIHWVPSWLNLLVHIFMYYYYGMSALGYKVWWKQYLTTFQIIQFVIDVTFCLLALFTRLAWDFGFPSYRCWGEYSAASIGIGVIASYYFLFLGLFKRLYPVEKEKERREPSSPTSPTNGGPYSSKDVHANTNANTNANDGLVKRKPKANPQN